MDGRERPMAGTDGVGTGISFPGSGAGSGDGAGVVPPTFSKYHAAANPSLPPGSRTRTHWPFCPTLARSSDLRSISCVPARTETTMFAGLDIFGLERMFKPEVTESITRTEIPLDGAELVVG